MPHHEFLITVETEDDDDAFIQDDMYEAIENGGFWSYTIEEVTHG